MYETNLTKTELILYAILNEFLIYSSFKKKDWVSLFASNGERDNLTLLRTKMIGIVVKGSWESVC